MHSKNENFSEQGSFFCWKPAAWLRVIGDDALTFLQGQCTNDLRGLQTSPAVYGLWLNHKGRVQADSFVVAGGPGEYWIGSYHCSAGSIRERLDAFVIADDVVIEDQTAEWSGITIFGLGNSATVLGAVPSLIFPGRRALKQHQEFVYRNEQLPHVLAHLANIRQRDAVEMERLRISDVIPAVPADIGPGELPNEGGLDEVAISFTKGCYLGQEVMARLKSMGQVRRRLLRVHGTGPLPSLPAAIFSADRRIGEIRTAVASDDGYVGLALLNLLNLKQDTALTFGPEVNGTVELSTAL